MALEIGEEHTRFVSWAEKNGITINGVAPAKFPGRGMGIVATRDIKAGETLVHVHSKAIISHASPQIFKMPSGRMWSKDLSVHGRLAAYLALRCNDENFEYKAWRDTWPSIREFRQILPIYWSDEAQDLLPHAAKEILTKQQRNIEADFCAVSATCISESEASFPKIDKDLFIYTWMIVNTRCFYWDYLDLPKVSPRLPRMRKDLTADDRYAMCPFMDYFNHTGDEGCVTETNRDGYYVVANQDYQAGTELYASYGTHTNDTLLAEYGFILEDNPHDAITLDHLILPDLTFKQYELLRMDKFLGNYTLSRGSPSPVTCHRTQAALRYLTIPYRRYAAFEAGLDEGTPEEQQIVDRHLVGLLEQYDRVFKTLLEDVEALEDKMGEQRATLKKRWVQIRCLVNQAKWALRDKL
ncbi:SET domain-containing protein [Sporormia fimetaria CBS 119925]|uniref:SET domain-containing protein n=1 Tax=Sporormia fimetaria CBS 119925 TaxID=1340428 RepID=A0A6A6VCL3_9PLEO|nr:SET domain-containing protein [Sporormia fimetaria CBS 119925]